MLFGFLKMLPGFNNILCRIPIDAFRLCIYLACHLRKRFMLLFRLAGFNEDCTLFQNLFGCRFCQFEPNSYLDPWRLGLETLSLFGLQAGSVGLFRTSWWAKGALLEFTLSPKATTQGPWKNQPLTTRNEQKKEASRSSVSPIKEKIYIWTSHLPVVRVYFGKAIGRVGIVWPNLVGRGTIPAGPVTLSQPNFEGCLTIG